MRSTSCAVEISEVLKYIREATTSTAVIWTNADAEALGNIEDAVRIVSVS